MCGIVGIAGKITAVEDKLFRSLLFFDMVRGLDSTGIMAVNNSNEVLVFKDNVPAHTLISNKEFENLTRPINKVLLGHNRAATRGKINAANAHPFKHGKITGVHNGTLFNVRNLPDHVKFEVDSENIIYALDNLGSSQTYKLLNGAVALVWWDSENNNLNFIRNNDRPLSYCYLNDGETLVWSSEHLILKFCLERCGLAAKDNKMYSTTIDNLYTFNIPKDKPAIYKMKPKIRKLAPFSHPVYTNVHNTYKVNGAAYSYAGGSNYYLKDFEYFKGSKIIFSNLKLEDKYICGTEQGHKDVNVFCFTGDNGYKKIRSKITDTPGLTLEGRILTVAYTENRKDIYVSPDNLMEANQVVEFKKKQRNLLSRIFSG